MALPTPAEQLDIATRLGLSIAQVQGLASALGISPAIIWEWLKKKLKEPGKKLPRPGKGLPAFDVPGWVVVAIVGYILWQWD